jgi:hypothetical protein
VNVDEVMTQAGAPRAEATLTRMTLMNTRAAADT